MKLTDMNTIYVTEQDYERLLQLVLAQRTVSGPRAVEALNKELKRARVVAPEEIPAEVVTMNSLVRLRETQGAAEMEISVVYPKDANVPRRRISVLAPVGTAILGCRVGDEVKWAGRVGTIKYTVEEVIYQPEMAGDFNL